MMMILKMKTPMMMQRSGFIALNKPNTKQSLKPCKAKTHLLRKVRIIKTNN